MITITVSIFILLVSSAVLAEKEAHLCEIPSSAPKKIEKVINGCQDEIKVAILAEALEAFNISDHAKNRTKRSTFSEDEKRIAGCLLQCVYRKMNAVNEQGFPTVEGLVALYSEGVTQREYIIATLQAVTKCLSKAQKKHLTTPQSLQGDIARLTSTKPELENAIRDVVPILKLLRMEGLSILDIISRIVQEQGKTCDIAYDIFDCVSENIGAYCGQTP